MLTVILTGGKSSRLGQDKALLQLDGTTAALALAERYAQLGPVAFSVDRAGRFPCGDFPELPDAYPGLGPLNGLYSAFTRTDAQLVFLTATDMPYGDVGLVRLLMERLGDHDGCAVRRSSGQVETLYALYTRRCLPLVKEALEGSRRSMMRIYDRLDMLLLEEAELTDWDLERIFCNVNTREELSLWPAPGPCSSER